LEKRIDKFTIAVNHKLSEECDHVVFMLWGNFAKSKSELIDQNKHLILASAHPSPLAGKAFFGNHHFSLANQYLKEKGKVEIDWSLPK
jgi:uracil-DNA glycosylase